MEPERPSYHPSTGLLVRIWNDHLVSPRLKYAGLMLTCSGSIMCPWLTIREVKVDVEIVSAPDFL